MHNRKYSFFAFLLLFVLHACYDDTGVISGDRMDAPPAIDFQRAIGLVHKDTTLEVNEFFRLRLNVERGTSSIDRIEVFADNSPLPDEEVAFNDTIGNTYIANIQGFNNVFINVDIRKPVPTVDTVLYEFLVISEENDTAIGDFNIRYHEPIDLFFTTGNFDGIAGTLLNQDSVGFGGLSLRTGRQFDDLSPEIQIRDQGSDITDSRFSVWRKQIAGFNNTEVRFTSLGQIDTNLTFDNLKYKQDIQAAFLLGNTFIANDILADSSQTPVRTIATDPIGQEKVSPPVNVGDVFSVRQDSMFYYLIQCTAIQEDDQSNNDFYQFLIKY